MNEYKLYREEQLQITEDVMKARNSTEWIIRINKVIKNFTYAIIKSYEYARLMENPLEDTENSWMYSFYLEDAVYRDIVLWELFRQFINEFLECGYGVDDEISIFSFLNSAIVRRKIGNTGVGRLKKYLKCTDHQEVRNKLRNQFTHSLDSTSSYIFHRVNDSGKIQADLSKLFPKHPYENIVFVLNDVKKYLGFVEEYLAQLEKFLVDKVMMVTVKCNMRCGKESEDTDTWSINILKEKAEQILCPCINPCDHAIEYEGNTVCKPASVCYCRINETDEKYKGEIELYMGYEEMKKAFLKDDNLLGDDGAI